MTYYFIEYYEGIIPEFDHWYKDLELCKSDWKWDATKKIYKITIEEVKP